MATISTGPLLNLNFASPGWQKIGFAALGQTTNDFWNISWSQDQDSAATPNLLWADSSPSGAGVIVDNGPGLWGNDSEDPMYRTYIYPFDAGHLYVTLTNLPAGTYDFYLYAHGGATEANGIFELWSGQTSFGLRATTIWGSAWNSTNWEEGQQYTVYRNVPVSSETPVVIDVFPNSTGYALVNGLQVVPSSAVPRDPPPLERLLNVNFASPGWLKTGFAAVGQTTNDFWNISWSQNVPAAATTNLLWADGSSSAAGILVQNGPGLWGNDTDDPMYKTYIYPGSGQITLTLTNLPTAHYDFYLYGHAPSDDGNGIFELVNGGVSQGIKATTMWGPVWNSLDWQESHQYVVFRDVAVSNTQPVVINVLPSASGYALVAGLQIAVPLDRDGDQLPDWWELKYFGDLSQTAGGDYDGDGVSNLDEFLNGTDPNTIDFTTSYTNDCVAGNVVSGTLTVLGGVPAQMAVLVNNTNLDSAVWSTLSPAFNVALPPVDGRYEVLVGLRGRAPDSQQTWQGTVLTRDTSPPLIVITNPATCTLTRPMIQLQGYAMEPLLNLRYDLANAAGQFTNMEAVTTHRVYDATLHAYTTNFFQCFDIDLTNGNNTITLRATDWAGNVTVANVTYTLISDTNPPVITLVWPQDGMTVCGDSFTMSGSLDDPTATVTVSLVDAAGVTNLLNGLVERHGPFWVEDLPLSDGTNRLSILAVDAWGNSSTTNIVVIKSPFSLSFSPLDPSQLQQLTTTLYGTMADTTYTLRVNGILATVYPGGAWQAEGVPVGSGSTACFTAVAYPPGEDLHPEHAVSANSSPVKGDMVKYVSQDTQAATKTEHRHTDIYSSEDLLTKIEWSEIDSSLDRGHEWKYNVPSQGRWVLAESGHGSVSGDFANNCRATVEWPPAATPETSVGAWSVNPDCGGFRADDNPPKVGNEYCQVTAITNLNSGPAQIRDPSSPNCGYYQKTSGQRSYTRTAQTTLMLFTGGKAIAHRKNLFSLSATVNRVLDKFAWPPLAGARQEGISPSQTEITVGDFGKLGSDGRAYKVFEDFTPVNITPRVPGCDFYTFNVEPQKHRLIVQANGCFLAGERIRPMARWAVGEKINLDPVFVPALLEEPQKTVKWTLAGDYINAFKVWLLGITGPVGYDYAENAYNAAYGLTDFRVDDSRLRQESTFAWWKTGSTADYQANQVTVAMNLTFQNGQTAVITCRGLLGMHQPTVAWDAQQYVPGVVHGRALEVIVPDPDGYSPPATTYLLQVKVGAFDDSSDRLQLGAHSDSLVGGQFGVTQLMTRDSLPEAFGDWRLDNSFPYDAADYLPRPSGQRTAVYIFGDGPDCPFGGYMTDSFKQYFMYRPSTPGSIWVTLGTATWDWHGEIVFSGTAPGHFEWVSRHVYHSQSIQPSSEFPEWIHRKLNF